MTAGIEDLRKVNLELSEVLRLTIIDKQDALARSEEQIKKLREERDFWEQTWGAWKRRTEVGDDTIARATAENRKLRDELVGLRESWYTRAVAAEDRATKAEEGLREAIETLGAVQEELRLIDMKDRALYNPALRPQIALTVARIKGLLPP